MRGKQKAVNAGGFGRLWRATETPSQENGLKTNFKSACIRAHGRGMMPVPRSITGCRLGGLIPKGEQSPRLSVAFFFGRLFKLMALLRPDSVRARRVGTLRGCCFPFGQSANPRGVAHHLGGSVGGFKNQPKGA